MMDLFQICAYEGLDIFLEIMFFSVIIAVIIAVVIYIIGSLFLSKFHKLLFGWGTVLAWLPFTRTYILGKVTFNKTMGWIMVGCNLFLSFANSNNYSFVYLYEFVEFGLFIYAFIKYKKIKDGKIDVREAALMSDGYSFEKPSVPVNYNSSMDGYPASNTNKINSDNQVMSAFCTKCGQKFDDNNIRFCTNCGQARM